MSRRTFHKDVGGAAAAEFALILPLMLIVAFAIFEAGRVFWSYNIVQSSARDAARYAARLPITCLGEDGSFDNGADATLEVQRLARTGTIDAGGTPLLPGWTQDDSVSVVIKCKDNSARGMKGIYADRDGIPRITVTAGAPYGLMFGGLFGGLEIPTVSVSNAEAWTL